MLLLGAWESAFEGDASSHCALRRRSVADRAIGVDLFLVMCCRNTAVWFVGREVLVAERVWTTEVADAEEIYGITHRSPFNVGISRSADLRRVFHLGTTSSMDGSGYSHVRVFRKAASGKRAQPSRYCAAPFNAVLRSAKTPRLLLRPLDSPHGNRAKAGRPLWN